MRWPLAMRRARDGREDLSSFKTLRTAATSLPVSARTVTIMRGTSRTGQPGRLPSESPKRFQVDRPGIGTVSAGERRMRNVVKATQTDAVGINTRVGMLDWTSVSTHLDDHGWAMVEKLLTADECETIAGLYDDDGRFRSHVVMARHGFGRGEGPLCRLCSHCESRKEAPWIGGGSSKRQCGFSGLCSSEGSGSAAVSKL